MARRRVTSSVKRCGAAAPQLCSIIPPGLVCRRESLIGGRFAPRQRAQTEVCATAERLDVVQDRVTSPGTREVVGSNPTWSNKKDGGLKAAATWPVAQWIERRMFPSSSFRERKEVPSWKKSCLWKDRC